MRASAHCHPDSARPKPTELPPPAAPGNESVVSLDLVAAERPIALPCFRGATLPLWTFSDFGLPVVRLKFGERLEATLENNLPRDGEHTSVHWHGIRLPNDQDGVPYLTQQPVWPGETLRLQLRSAGHRHLLLPSALRHGRATRPRNGGCADRRR